MKQILLIMNEKENFVIEDLDDHHLVIKAEHEWRVRQELETEVMLLVLVAFVSLIFASAREEYVQCRLIEANS